jgi:hypothetical protein
VETMSGMAIQDIVRDVFLSLSERSGWTDRFASHHAQYR